MGEGVGRAVARGVCSLGVGCKVKPGGPNSLSRMVGLGVAGGGVAAVVTTVVGDGVATGDGGDWGVAVMGGGGKLAGVATGVMVATGE